MKAVWSYVRLSAKATYQQISFAASAIFFKISDARRSPNKVPSLITVGPLDKNYLTPDSDAFISEDVIV